MEKAKSEETEKDNILRKQSYLANDEKFTDDFQSDISFSHNSICTTEQDRNTSEHISSNSDAPSDNDKVSIIKNSTKETEIDALQKQVKHLREIKKEDDKTITLLQSKLKYSIMEFKLDEKNLGVVKRSPGNDLFCIKDRVKYTDSVKLVRALEEVEIFKNFMITSQHKCVKSDSGVRLENVMLQKQVKDLENQKNELIAALKKQMQLIDIMNRQKIHLQEDILLNFTEEEFIKMTLQNTRSFIH